MTSENSKETVAKIYGEAIGNAFVDIIKDSTDNDAEIAKLREALKVAREELEMLKSKALLSWVVLPDWYTNEELGSDFYPDAEDKQKENIANTLTRIQSIMGDKESK